MVSVKYAVIESNQNQVVNIIIAPQGYSITNCELIEIEANVFCEEGMYLNTANNIFYQDKEFTKVYPDPQTESY